jgi:3-hydroxyisobutyrate dehydrogenase-like beta-hydroxyacid dehydrogenase
MSEIITLGEPPSIDRAPRGQRLMQADAGAAPPLGIIGLSIPGRAIALRLLRAGHRLLACDADSDRVRAYAEAAGPDADVTDLPDEVGRRCDTVLLMLDLGADAATIHDALQTTLPIGGLIIDMGPALPGHLRRLAAELSERGLHLVDAPILPGDPAIVLVGGSPADVARALPVLEMLGVCVPTGAVGSAQALSALIAELDEPPDLARVRDWARQ